MPTGPVPDTFKHPGRPLRIEIESRQQTTGLGQRKIVEIDLPADRKRRMCLVRAQLHRCRDTNNDKPQALEIGLGRPRVMAGSQPGKKLLRKWQTQRVFYFIEKHGDRAARVRQHDFPEKIEKAMLHGQRTAFLPPRLQVDAKPEIANDPVGDAVEPAGWVGACLFGDHLGQIDDGNQFVFIAETSSRGRHQAGLADLARTQYVAVVVFTQTVEQLFVCLAQNIARPVGLHRATHDIKTAGRRSAVAGSQFTLGSAHGPPHSG